MGGKKGMSQTIWIVTVIIVCLATAMILIMMMTNTSSNVTKSTDEPIQNGGNIIKIETCKALCDSCSKTGTCGSWGTDTGKGCTEEGVNIQCPYE